MPKLELKNLNKTFSSKVVPVKDVSLSVNEGEFLTLLGPSGCGKSTVLRMIAGLEQPTRGQILIDDRNVTNVRPGDRNIAMVFQSYALYPHMNVYDNLCSALRLQKTPEAEIRQRVATAAQALDLNGLLDRKPGQLSGGQRQRVALGRALVRRPDVFLLDEPLSNLDALLRERVRAELKQLFASQRVPVVYVTHDQTEAMTLSSKVAVLNEGFVQQLDPPHRIYSHPANLFVAGFVGSPQMNLLTLTCEGRNAIFGDFRIPLPSRLTSIPRQVVLGIRPEHVQLIRLERSEPRNLENSDSQNSDYKNSDPTVQGQVFLVENLGMHSLVSLQVHGTRQETHTLRALLPPDHNWQNQNLILSLPLEHMHWYEAESGNSLLQDTYQPVAA